VLRSRPARYQELLVLALALCSLALGLAPPFALELVEIGRVAGAGVALP
jgi:hypothetical protein